MNDGFEYTVAQLTGMKIGALKAIARELLDEIRGPHDVVLGPGGRSSKAALTTFIRELQDHIFDLALERFKAERIAAARAAARSSEGAICRESRSPLVPGARGTMAAPGNEIRDSSRHPIGP